MKGWQAHEAPDPTQPRDSARRDFAVVAGAILFFVVIAFVAQLLNPMPL